jgi:hypothetical protein
MLLQAFIAKVPTSTRRSAPVTIQAALEKVAPMTSFGSSSLPKTCPPESGAVLFKLRFSHKLVFQAGIEHLAWLDRVDFDPIGFIF